jgi:hypothetical protein
MSLVETVANVAVCYNVALLTQGARISAVRADDNARRERRDHRDVAVLSLARGYMLRRPFETLR